MNYYETLDAIKALGLEYANNGIEAGEFRPMESPLSGEYSDGLSGQDILDALYKVDGFDAPLKPFSDLEEFEQTDILDYWEDGYNSAEWPSRGGAFANYGEIVGYFYLAQEYTPEQLHAAYIERWIQGGACSPAARDMSMEDILNQRAAYEGIDRDDEYSFDSEDFPKTILAD